MEGIYYKAISSRFQGIFGIECTGWGFGFNANGRYGGRQAAWYLQFRCFISKMLYVQFKGQDAQGRPAGQSVSQSVNETRISFTHHEIKNFKIPDHIPDHISD
jgi:hypothetical protein